MGPWGRATSNGWQGTGSQQDTETDDQEVGGKPGEKNLELREEEVFKEEERAICEKCSLVVAHDGDVPGQPFQEEVWQNLIRGDRRGAPILERGLAGGRVARAGAEDGRLESRAGALGETREILKAKGLGFPRQEGALTETLPEARGRQGQEPEAGGSSCSEPLCSAPGRGHNRLLRNEPL